jgi:hypothetical protein
VKSRRTASGFASGSEEHAAHVRTRRALTESRLARLLKEAGSTANFRVICNLVFEYHPTDFQAYLAQLFALFDSLPNRTDIDTLLPVIQDAWNYFPHRALGGKSPVEIHLEFHPDGLSRLKLEGEH